MENKNESKSVQDQIVENWLHHQVTKAFDLLKTDPARAITVESIRTRLACEHLKN